MVDGGKTENWWWTMRPSTPSLWSIRAGRPDDAALDDEETGPSVDSLQGETGQSAVDSQAAADVMRMMLMTTVVAVAAVEEEEEAVEEEEAGMSFRIALFPRLCASPKTHQHTHTHRSLVARALFVLVLVSTREQIFRHSFSVYRPRNPSVVEIDGIRWSFKQTEREREQRGVRASTTLMKEKQSVVFVRYVATVGKMILQN